MFPFGRQHGPPTNRGNIPSRYQWPKASAFKGGVDSLCRPLGTSFFWGGSFFSKHLFKVACHRSRHVFFQTACTLRYAFLVWAKRKLTTKNKKNPQTICKLHLLTSPFSEALLKQIVHGANIRPVFPLCQGTSTWLITSRRPIILEISNLRCKLRTVQPHELHDLHISKGYYSIPWGVRRPFK